MSNTPQRLERLRLEAECLTSAPPMPDELWVVHLQGPMISVSVGFHAKRKRCERLRGLCRAHASTLPQGAERRVWELLEWDLNEIVRSRPNP